MREGQVAGSKLLEFIDDTLAWASDISDQWAGTPLEKIIDVQQAQLIRAVEKQDFELAYRFMCDLGQTLDYVSKQEVEG